MIERPRDQANHWRRLASRLIFAWGAVLSAASYALLTIAGRAPLLDDHITTTALVMLFTYLSMRVVLEFWVALQLRRRERWRRLLSRDRQRSLPAAWARIDQLGRA